MRMNFTSIKVKTGSYFDGSLPVVFLAWITAIMLRVSDAFIFIYYRPLAYVFEFNDFIKGLLIDLSLISVFILILYLILGWLPDKSRKAIKFLFFIGLIIYSALYLSLSYYTSQSELLPDGLIFSYNSANKEHLLANYAYLWIPVIVILILIFATIYFLYKRINNRPFFSRRKEVFLIIIWGILVLVPFHYLFLQNEPSESKLAMIENKVRYFAFSFYNESAINNDENSYS